MNKSLSLTEKSQAIFNDTISKHLVSLEDFRLDKLKDFNKRKSVCKRYAIVVWLLAFAACYMLDVTDAIYVISVIYAIGIGIFITRPLGKYERRYLKLYRRDFAPVVFKELFNFDYLGEKSVYKDLKDFSILNNFDFCVNEDYFSGDMDNVKFEFTELRTIFDKANDADKVFKGCAALLTFEDDFKSNITIKSDHWHEQNNKSAKSKLEKVEINNSEFNKYFTIKSDNADYAKALVNDKIIDKLIEYSVDLHVLFNEEFVNLAPEFKKQIDANKKDGIDDEMATSVLELEVKDNQLLILMRGQHDFLAPNDINTSVYDTSSLAVIEKQINVVKDITNLFKLSMLKNK